MNGVRKKETRVGSANDGNSQDFNKKLIETSPTFFVAIDAGGKTVMINPTMLKALGYTEKEALDTDYLSTFVPPGEHESVSAILKKSVQPRECTVNENHVLTKDGRKLLVEWHSRPIFKTSGEFDFFLGVGVDVTQRHRAEEALRESEERFREMAELLPVVIYEADLEGNMTYANAAAFDTFGYRREDFKKGVNVLETVAPEDRSSVTERMQAVLKSQYPGGGKEYTAMRKDGTRFPVIIYSSVINRDNTPVGIRGIVVDITHCKIAEEKEKLYLRQLMQADKMISLGTLVSGVAHEINNPNNGIMLNIPILKEIFDDIIPILGPHCRKSEDFKPGGIAFPKLQKSVNRLFDGMHRSSERIRNIVTHLKNFAIPTNPSDLTQWVQINEVLKSSVTLLHNMIWKSTRNFYVEYGENIPRIKGNFQRLEQVIINLIQNACQALENKDKENKDKAIHISTSHALEKKKSKVRLIVDDEGVGIPGKDLKFITDPFFTTRRDSGGIGIGLSISVRIIKEHGGTLDIRSKTGAGSTFTVTLPVNNGEFQ